MMTPLFPPNTIQSATIPRDARKHKPPRANQNAILEQAFCGAFTKLDP